MKNKGALPGISPYKIEILKQLSEPKNISEIMRLVGISYKETYRHIKELDECLWIHKKKQKEEKHAPVLITISPAGKMILELVSLKDMTEKASTPDDVDDMARAMLEAGKRMQKFKEEMLKAK